MLDKLRAEALALIASAPHCTLSTAGPAGVQASIVTCAVCDDCLYALVPATADHLFNLEHSTELVLTAPPWQVRGVALALGETDGLHRTVPHELLARAGAEGYTLIEVFPLRIHIEPTGSRRYRETIDFDIYTPSAAPEPGPGIS
jgi:hypothetical protein